MRPDCNPLDPQWFVSNQLDLDEAVRELRDAAAANDCVLPGFNERLLGWSPVWTLACRLLRRPKPYWRHGAEMNRALRLSGLRRLIPIGDVAGVIREQLARQTQPPAHALDPA